jgi:hypothetical protein
LFCINSNKKIINATKKKKNVEEFKKFDLGQVTSLLPNEIKVPTRLNSIPAKTANDPKTIISKLNSSNKFQPKK